MLTKEVRTSRYENLSKQGYGCSSHFTMRPEDLVAGASKGAKQKHTPPGEPSLCPRSVGRPRRASPGGQESCSDGFSTQASGPRSHRAGTFLCKADRLA